MADEARPTRLLILGGTGEAGALARALEDYPNLEVISSLAGRTTGGRDLPGALRIGGFGGVDGLAAYLATSDIDLLVDATHPYAAQITRNAADAATAAGVPRLRLLRPPWPEQPGDRWQRVPDTASAAQALTDYGRNVFLATGRQELAAFAQLTDRRFLVRLVDPPEAPLELPNATVVTGRGTFEEAGDRALLQEHAIDVVVSKNSGGPGAYAKIAAARSLALPVVMIDRPAEPESETVVDVEAAVDWIFHHQDTKTPRGKEK